MEQLAKLLTYALIFVSTDYAPPVSEKTPLVLLLTNVNLLLFVELVSVAAGTLVDIQQEDSPVI